MNYALTIDDLTQRLLDLPTEIAIAEAGEYELTVVLTQTRAALARREAELLTTGQVTGSNEAQRKASLFLLTEAEQAAVTLAEQRLASARLHLNEKRNLFSALRAIARMRGRDD